MARLRKILTDVGEVWINTEMVKDVRRFRTDGSRVLMAGEVEPFICLRTPAETLVEIISTDEPRP